MTDNERLWGGRRKGAGRKPKKYRRQLLSINCTTDELRKIQQALTTRERAEVLLRAVELK